MKKVTSLLLLFFFLITVAPVSVKAETVKSEMGILAGKKKKYKGYKKPRSKKFLGIFKRKTDCGCPNH